MTSSVWLAVGAVAASLLGRGVGPATLILLATAVGVAAAGLRLSRRDRTGRIRAGRNRGHRDRPPPRRGRRRGVATGRFAAGGVGTVDG